CPQLTDEELAEGEVVCQCPVGLVEERHALVPDELGGSPLFLLACCRQLEGVELGVLAPGVAARAADKPADRALVDPASGGRGWSEIGIIRVGDDDREAVRTPG